MPVLKAKPTPPEHTQAAQGIPFSNTLLARTDVERIITLAERCKASRSGSAGRHHVGNMQVLTFPSEEALEMVRKFIFEGPSKEYRELRAALKALPRPQRKELYALMLFGRGNFTKFHDALIYARRRNDAHDAAVIAEKVRRLAEYLRTGLGITGNGVAEGLGSWRGRARKRLGSGGKADGVYRSSGTRRRK